MQMRIGRSGEHNQGSRIAHDCGQTRGFGFVGDTSAWDSRPFSFAGQPTNPAWYHNLVANPSVKAEIGSQTLPLTAHIADDAAREPIWTAHKTDNPGFAEYETMTTRQIPVVILEPAR